MIKVLLVEPYAIVRKGIELTFLNTGIEVTGEATSGEEGISLALKHDYDVILMDMPLPKRGGLDVIRQIVAEKPDQQILVLTMYPPEDYAIRAIKAGAAGYITKDIRPSELVRIVRKVADGRKYLTEEVADLLIREVAQPDATEIHHPLSDREFEVFLRIAAGRTVSYIAEEFSLSVKTISTHRTRILEKMGMRNNAELIHYAATHSILQMLVRPLVSRRVEMAAHK